MDEVKKEHSVPKIIIRKVQRGNVFKYATLVLLAVLILGLGYMFFGDKISFGGDIAAKVNGEKITISELNRIYDSLPTQQKALMTKEVILEQLVQLKVIYQEAKKDGFVVSEDEANSKLNELFVSAGITREQFVQSLEQQGLSEKDFIKSFVEQMTAEKLINKTILQKIEISDKDASEYYLKNIAEFQTGERVKVKHVLIGDANLSTAEKEAKAKDLLKKINQNNFCEYVTKYSTDVASVPTCGEYTFGKEDPYVEEFKNLSFSQNAGEIGTVNTQFGTHIILTLKKIPAGVTPFVEASAQIKLLLKSNIAETEYETYYQSLKAKSDIKLYDDALL